MQGLLPYIQDGEKPWRMRAFTTWTWEMEMLCLVFSTAMEVSYNQFRLLSQQVRQHYLWEIAEELNIIQAEIVQKSTQWNLQTCRLDHAKPRRTEWTP
jgi:hypothetical protein